MRTFLLACLGVALVGIPCPAAPVPPRADVSDLLRRLKSDDPAVRDGARDGLVKAGASSVPGLVELFEGKDAVLRARAASVLEKLGPAARNAVPDLLKGLQKNPQATTTVNLLAIRVLGRIGPPAQEAVPTLVKGLQAGPAINPVRVHAAMALGGIGPKAREAVPALIEALKEPVTQSGPLRLHAATALGQIGPAAKEATDALEKAAGDSEPAIRAAAKAALERIRTRK